MKQYIGTKIVHAQPAFKATGVRKDCKVANQVLTHEQLEDCKASGWEFTDQKEGYEVRYADGYMSWSPKDVFEDAYRQTDAMNFGLAIEAMKKGYRVARKGWNGKGIYLELQVPDEHSKMTLPYIYIVTNGLITYNPHAPKGCVPWLASQTDMLADDWYIVE